ncbi:hypothetical protein EXU85_16835 [Spirosoma sp. KCTC 42546]|uniref:hypothetical protein n=1 Tax=Spirosoma sp. KCTC 42546 TaxID=2520506 RepID=UPI00115AD52C|nr:hypothetical protein [Spirosoma sp. KCTC 42546]QDK80178.1 hypothetical protein EXU85_16835 [Spirosoma sp. KCTC 42546]
MKQVLLSLLLIGFGGILICCQEITPLTPTNPAVGNWIIARHDIYHLPSWFVTKTGSEYKTTSTDTVFSNATLATLFNVNSLTFTQDQRFSELYPVLDLTTGQARGQTDTGTWVLADSVVSLNVVNSFPHKLTYRAATNQLVTDRFPQTVTGRFSDGSLYTISYTIQMFYRRGDP